MAMRVVLALALMNLLSACAQTAGMDFPQKTAPNVKYMTAAEAKEAINELAQVKERQQGLAEPKQKPTATP